MSFGPLGDAERANFETLTRAAEAGNLALVRSCETDGGREVALVCAVGYDDGMYQIVPLAVMIAGDPFELYADPTGDLPDDTREEGSAEDGNR